ncbi:uridine kinase [Papillibacter cinnamivorans]|uniref:Uridine kinase n=1 Tax=Papillibacter cinnamivorans DSM 12816 TaxID=1122930 RepID=A0A1W2A0H1_9FIRM|nr:uridine kinase [Papillibacter cinnamivorans]SMC54144.1 uridine kinase [Papillibacter cinnamivorans DSM 12816]
METLVIGIAGGTGSGKTTLTRSLKERFGDDISVINYDSYYKSYDTLSFEERRKLNFDQPDAFDTPLMAEHLRSLIGGRPVACPVYSFTEYIRTKDTVTIQPAKVLLAEGLLILQNPELRKMMDIKIFVDADADVRLLRRILRDVKKRGRTLDSVAAQYLATVKPMHDEYVEPSRRYADIVVPGGGRNPVALGLIIGRIQEHLKSS